VSVVIPARNEAALVGCAVRSVRAGADEVLVVDGASSDGTSDVARAAGARVVQGPPSRGLQLDLGARAARGEWLVFLHADTRLEPGWREALGEVGAAPGGAFRFAIDSERPSYRLIEIAVAMRCRALGLPYGDQAIFATRSAYALCGGFPPLPIMEDVAFVRRLRGLGPLALLRPRAITHPRRWERLGVVRASARNLWLMARYATGTPPERLARAYDS
jgi:rSAM/selenodomain-associated transferase 2